MHSLRRSLNVEQFQARTYDLLHGLHDRRQNLVGHDLVRLTGQTGLQGSAPGDSQLGTNEDDVDSSSNRPQEIFVIRSRPAVQGEEDPRCLLDLGNSLEIQMLFGFPFDHAFQHSVHLANCRTDVDSNRLYELASFLRCSEVAEFV